jgi:hypothetical protein
MSDYRSYLERIELKLNRFRNQFRLHSEKCKNYTDKQACEVLTSNVCSWDSLRRNCSLQSMDTLLDTWFASFCSNLDTLKDYDKTSFYKYAKTILMFKESISGIRVDLPETARVTEACKIVRNAIDLIKIYIKESNIQFGEGEVVKGVSKSLEKMKKKGKLKFNKFTLAQIFAVFVFSLINPYGVNLLGLHTRPLAATANKTAPNLTLAASNLPLAAPMVAIVDWKKIEKKSDSIHNQLVMMSRNKKYVRQPAYLGLNLKTSTLNPGTYEDETDEFFIKYMNDLYEIKSNKTLKLDRILSFSKKFLIPEEVTTIKKLFDGAITIRCHPADLDLFLPVQERFEAVVSGFPAQTIALLRRSHTQIFISPNSTLNNGSVGGFAAMSPTSPEHTGNLIVLHSHNLRNQELAYYILLHEFAHAVDFSFDNMYSLKGVFGKYNKDAPRHNLEPLNKMTRITRYRDLRVLDVALATGMETLESLGIFESDWVKYRAARIRERIIHFYEVILKDFLQKSHDSQKLKPYFLSCPSEFWAEMSATYLHRVKLMVPRYPTYEINYNLMTSYLQEFPELFNLLRSVYGDPHV